MGLPRRNRARNADAARLSASHGLSPAYRSGVGVLCTRGYFRSTLLRDGVTLLDQYVWYVANSQGHSWPVGMLKPNQFGLSDVYGDAWEWLQDRRVDYPPDTGTVTLDNEDTVLVVTNTVARTRRGGSWSYDKETTRSAHRGATTYFPDQRRDSVGFRVARTLPAPAVP